jgi:hypothetical protein
MWLAIGFFVFAALWAGGVVYLIANGGVHTRNGFIGIEKTPQEMDGMIARVKARQARYDKWRNSLSPQATDGLKRNQGVRRESD